MYIVVRRTTDWTNEAAVRAQLPAGFAPLVGLWNDTFDMPYHHFRQQLKQIAQANHAGVKGAMPATLQDVPPGALIAPVDDDDWFSPEMAKVVADNLDERHRGYRWPSRFLEVPPNFDQWLGAWRRRLFPSTPLRWLCTTNNYVIENIPGVGWIVDSHIQATEWFVQNDALVKVLDVPLSLQNRNLASQTALLFRSGVMMTRSKLLRRHRQYRALYARPSRALLAWYGPSIASMAALMQNLRVRRE
ncbi:MAG TPA: hypothetical protein VN812_09295 [Candidatus Acidoferrales bacterium]|nr:hypothetical protein [Candidatus Acidoferrales bacterium]